MNKEYVIEGKLKQLSNWMAAGFLVIYLAALIILFPPYQLLSVMLWIYCGIFALLIIRSPKWWLWGAVITICTLGFVPSLFGVFNKHIIDGSILSTTYIPQIQASELRGRVISLPLLGLPPSLFIWWIKEKKVFVPRSLIPIAVFGALMIGSSLHACMEYIRLSFMPFNYTIMVPEILERSPYARQWWKAGMPHVLMAFSLLLTFASLISSMLLLVTYNLKGKVDILKSVFSALTFAAVICVGYGIAQYKGIVPTLTPFGNFESTFQSQGSYGVFVGISCVFLFGRLALSEKRVSMYFLLFLFSLFGLFINQTRTALVALALTPFFIYAGHMILRHQSVFILNSWKRKAMLLLITVILISGFALSIPEVNKYILQICRNNFVMRTVESFDLDGDLDRILSGRLDIWAQCIDIWGETPIFGCGQGQLYWKLKIRGTPDTAANQFILVLAEMGIVGLGIFLWVIFSIFRELAKPVFSKRSGYDYASWLICCSLVVCILVQSFTVHVLHFLNLPLLIGVLVAIALASSKPRYEISESDLLHTNSSACDERQSNFPTVLPHLLMLPIIYLLKK
jgi:O-antigen ligase